MEKRRRARMNECLDQLKHLLLHISPNHRTKLEKADILEMTVAYLNQMQHPPSPSTSFGTFFSLLNYGCFLLRCR